MEHLKVVDDVREQNSWTVFVFLPCETHSNHPILTATNPASWSPWGLIGCTKAFPVRFFHRII